MKRSTKDGLLLWLYLAGIILLVVGILYLAYAYVRWEYRECKLVGHSTGYCVWKVLESDHK